METPEVLPDPIVIAPSCLARWQRRTAHASIIAYSMCTHGQGAELQKDEGGRWLAVLSCETAALAPKIDVLALGAMQMQVFLLSVKKKEKSK
jgi:hypothetical protein